MVTKAVDKQPLYLNTCLIAIERKLGWPDSQEWRHSHFEALSDELFDHTGVRLSPVTLKRLWGKVAYQSSPSISTLNTLAIYLGYKNWIDFQKSLEKAAITDQSDFTSREGKSWTYPYVLFVIIGLAGLLTTLGMVYYAQNTLSYSDLEFGFSPVSAGLPNTVTFHYNASQSNADSVFIQQSWDTKLRYQVEKNGDFYASTYYYPGFYVAKLILNDQIVLEKNLHIQSNGWLGTINYREIPFYLKEPDIRQQGQLAIREADLLAHGIPVHNEQPWVRLHYVEDLGLTKGQDFQFITRLKNTAGKRNTVCQNTKVLLLFSHTPIIVPLSIKGCTGVLKLKMPGTTVTGNQRDLTAFGVNFQEWVNLDIELEALKLTIKVNHTTAFQDNLPYHPGHLMGVRFDFHGSGIVDYIQLKSKDQVLFQE